MRRTSSAAEVRAAVLAALTVLLPQWLPGGEWDGHEYVALNPRRDDRTLGSFRIDSRTGRWRDHKTGPGGRDAVSLYAFIRMDIDYGAAIRELADDPQVQAAIACGVTAPPAKPANALKSSAAKLEQVRSLYDAAGPVSPGTAAHTYLSRERGLQQTTAWDRLRTHRLYYPGVGRGPALIAPVQALDGSLVGLHRIYLTPAGAKLDVPRSKMGLGQVRGGAVRFGEVGEELMICEGVEDALTLHQVFGMPVWAACGSRFMKSMAIPETVKTLIIAADNDSAGKFGAQEAGDAHNIHSRSVSIMRPSAGFKDFNDELRGIRHGE